MRTWLDIEKAHVHRNTSRIPVLHARFIMGKTEVGKELNLRLFEKGGAPLACAIMAFVQLYSEGQRHIVYRTPD